MNKLVATTAILLALSSPALAHDTVGGPMNSPMERAISKLPHDKAEDFRDTMQSAHEENADLYAQIQDLHHQMHDILVAPDFDAEAFVQKSRDIRKLHDKIGPNLDDAFATALSELSPNERLMMARAMEQQHKAMHKHMGKKHAAGITENNDSENNTTNTNTRNNPNNETTQ